MFPVAGTSRNAWPGRAAVGGGLAGPVRASGKFRSRPAGSSTHLQQIIAEEEAAVRAVGEAAQASAQAANRRIDLLETFEFELFGLVLVVLVLEGLFVVNPAVLKIQQFMGDLEPSHDELKAYATKLERSNKELQDFASVASHDLQEPLRKIQAFSDRLEVADAPRRSTSRDATTSTGSRTRRGECRP